MVVDRTRTAVGTLLLIVEPEMLVRIAVAEYLRECGYTVLEAGNVKEAIELLLAAEDIKVVLVDVGSSDDSSDQVAGFSLVHWIRRERPNIKVVMTAGVQRTARSAGDLCAIGPHSRKPYHHEELERRIRKLLTER